MTARPWRHATALGVGLGVGLLASTVRAECPKGGRIVDHEGKPAAGLVVQRGATTVVTDADGRYDLEGGTPDDPVEITMRQRVGSAVAFEVFFDREPIRFKRADGCAGDFDASNATGWTSALDPEDTDDAFALRVGFIRGFELMVQLAIALPAEPLRVEAWQRTASPRTSFWVGTHSYHPTPPREPLVGLGAEASRRGDRGAPDNREYHELGHHALAAALGASPHARADTSHGGYYVNPTSADAWTEGFATFFAMMVADQIEKRPAANLYRIAGTFVDLELNYRPWDFGGLEELAVAGLLLDLVDGERPRTMGGLPAVDTVDVIGQGASAIAVVTFGERTGSPRHVGRLALTVSSGDPIWSVDIDPSAWTDTTISRLVVALPPEGVDPTAITGAKWSTEARADDDPVTVPLEDVWAAIEGFRSTHEESNGKLFDVADLHAALRAKFGGRDGDGDGRDDIDQLFILHGLFADLDGDHVFDEGETIGSTAHPAGESSAGTKWQARPQRRVPAPAGLRASLATPQAVGRWWATSTSSSGHTRVTRLIASDAGLATLMPPPGLPAASVAVAADAEERVASLAERWSAEELHARAENEHATPLDVSVTLRKGEPSQASATVDPRWLFWGGAASAGFGVLLLLVGVVIGRSR